MSIFLILLVMTVLVLLIAVVAFFTSSETAFLSIQHIKLRQMLKEKRRGAQKIAFLKSRMDELLTLVLVGTNFVNTLTSALATAFTVKIVGSNGVAIATFFITFFITTFGEIIPKTVAAVRPEVVAGHSAPILIALSKILFPVVWLFTQVARGIGFLAGKIWTDDTMHMTTDELKTLIDVGENEGTLEKNEKTMLHKLFEFNDLHVYNIMRYRSLIKSVPETADRAQVVDAFTSSGFSRLPVYRVDPETIVGIIDYKTVLFRKRDTSSPRNYAQSCMQNVLFVPETLTALELLLKFRKERLDFAVALDEQGSTAGIVTMDDIMRTVFGRMTDENSVTAVSPEKRIQVISGKEFIVPGDMHLTDVNEILNLKLESDNYITLGGWLLEHFDALPSIGEALRYGNILFLVEDQLLRRIVSVRIKLHTG